MSTRSLGFGPVLILIDQIGQQLHTASENHIPKTSMLVWMKNPFEKPETQPECVFAGSADAERAPWLVIRAKDPGQKEMSEEGSSTSSLPSATTLPNKGQSALQHTKPSLFKHLIRIIFIVLIFITCLPFSRKDLDPGYLDLEIVTSRL